MTAPRSRWLGLDLALALAVGLLVLCLGVAPAYARGRWVWPLRPRPAVVAGFDAPGAPWAPGHRGVDLAGRPGEQVRAIGSGEVTFAAMLAGRGVVVVRHGLLRSTYEPVRPVMTVGERVSVGQVVATLDLPHSHCAPDACLHLGVLRGRHYVDPLSLLGPLPVRLKPAGPGRTATGHTSPPPSRAALSHGPRRGGAGRVSTSSFLSPFARSMLVVAVAAGSGVLLAGDRRRRRRLGVPARRAPPA